MYEPKSLEECKAVINKLISFIHSLEDPVRALKETSANLLYAYLDILELRKQNDELKDNLDSGCFDFEERGVMLLQLKTNKNKLTEIVPEFEKLRTEQVALVTKQFNLIDKEAIPYIQWICLKGQQAA